VPRLIALELEPGPAFVEELRRAFDGGDAVLPLDPRLAPPARRRLVEALRPSVVVLAGGERTRLAGGQPVEEGDALVVATSGTTGEPRGVVLTHEAVAASARATSARLAVDPARDRWCCCLPLAHVGGLSVVTRALLTGTPLEVLPAFDAATVLASARERGTTLVSLVPTTLRRLGEEGADAFRLVVLGGSAPPAELPGNVVTTYGMTETGSGVVYDGIPLDGVEVRITRGEGPSSTGEIELRGPMLLRGYRDGTSPLGADGWLRTGDAGRIAADGRLEVLGRLGELIITGGENVWPAAVEAVLSRHPAIAEVVVAGRPDQEWGERVVAFVVPREASRAPALGELRELVAGALAPWAAPRELVLVGSLPRTSIGKVRRGELAGRCEGPGQHTSCGSDRPSSSQAAATRQW
jgi:O-succinylbenzoic acid--CoA ligase